MSIHNAKGLEAKVVHVVIQQEAGDLTNEDQDRLIVNPEFFAGHPAPWPGRPSIRHVEALTTNRPSAGMPRRAASSM